MCMSLLALAFILQRLWRLAGAQILLKVLALQVRRTLPQGRQDGVSTSPGSRMPTTTGFRVGHDDSNVEFVNKIFSSRCHR